MKKIYVLLLGMACIFSSCSLVEPALRFGYSEFDDENCRRDSKKAVLNLVAALNNGDANGVKNLMSEKALAVQDNLDEQIEKLMGIASVKIDVPLYGGCDINYWSINYGKYTASGSDVLVLEGEDRLFLLSYDFIFHDDYYPCNVGFTRLEFLDENYAGKMFTEGNYDMWPCNGEEYGVFSAKGELPSGYDGVISVEGKEILLMKNVERERVITCDAIKVFMKDNSEGVAISDFIFEFGEPNARQNDFYYVWVLDDGSYACVYSDVDGSVSYINGQDCNGAFGIWSK